MTNMIMIDKFKNNKKLFLKVRDELFGNPNQFLFLELFEEYVNKIIYDDKTYYSLNDILKLISVKNDEFESSEINKIENFIN